MTFQIRKEAQVFVSKWSNIFLGMSLHLPSACAWNKSPTQGSKNHVCICFKSIMKSPSFSKAPQTTVLFTFSKILGLHSFLRRKNLNNNLFARVRTESGTTLACMIYVNCEIKNVAMMQTLPAMLRFLFSRVFAVEDGIRKGCPFSPLAFVLARELLAAEIKHCENIKGLHCWKAGNGLLENIKTALYADDVTLFLKDEHDMQKTLKRLAEFSTFSGLETNRMKSGNVAR